MNLTLYTCCGPIQFIDHGRFADRVKIVDASSPNIIIPILQPSVSAVMLSSEAPLEAPRAGVTTQKHELRDLNRTFEGSLRSNFDYLIKGQITSELIQMLMKNKLLSGYKELTIDIIQELVQQYASNYGGDNAVAIPFNLNKYQRFFVIADINDFSYYICRSENSHDIYGKLICTNTDRWIACQFENPAYLMELNLMRYTT